MRWGRARVRAPLRPSTGSSTGLSLSGFHQDPCARTLPELRGQRDCLPAAFDNAWLGVDVENSACLTSPLPISFTLLPRSLSPAMGALKTLTVSSFFVSSLAASAGDWRSRSIYQVSRFPGVPLCPHPNGH